MPLKIDRNEVSTKDNLTSYKQALRLEKFTDKEIRNRKRIDKANKSMEDSLRYAPKEIRDLVHKKMNEPAPLNPLAKASAASRSISSESSEHRPRKKTSFRTHPIASRIKFHCQRSNKFVDSFEMQFVDFEKSIKFIVNCHGATHTIEYSRASLFHNLQHDLQMVVPVFRELSPQPTEVTPEDRRLAKDLEIAPMMMARYGCTMNEALRALGIYRDAGIQIEDILPDYKPTKTKEEKEVKPITKILKRRIDL